jgi:Zn finger protein HypA/HybF involved in hydrogenase expression
MPSGKVNSDGSNSMRVTRPDLAREFHTQKNRDYNPDNLMAGTGKKLWWICSLKTCRHEWKATGNNRHTKNKGCPYCSGHVVHIDGRNSMRKTHPHLVKELHPTKNPDFNPDLVKVGTEQKVVWLCSSCQHEWITQVKGRGVNNTNCPACEGQQVHIDGRNSMARTHPHLAKELHPLKNCDYNSDNLISGTGKKLWWICSKCDHEWNTTGNSRTSSDTGCPACAGKAVHIDGRNSLTSKKPKLALEWHPIKNLKLTANDVTVGSSKRVWWLCNNCNNEWITSVSNRTSGKGCGACQGKVIHSDGSNSMRVTRPDLAREFHPTKNGKFTPDNLLAGTHKKLWWLCSKCDHEWQRDGQGRVQGSGCGCCAGQVLHTDGRNCMKNTHPELAIDFHPSKNGKMTPNNLIAGTSKMLWWICNDCNHTWRTTGNSRASGSQSGCPSCMDGGFKPDLPAYYYSFSFIGPRNEIWWYKGGISEDPKRRKKEIQNSLKSSKLFLNVKLVDQIYFEIGQHARDLELKLLREKKIRHHTIEKFSGKAELFSVNPIKYARERNWY